MPHLLARKSTALANEPSQLGQMPPRNAASGFLCASVQTANSPNRVKEQCIILCYAEVDVNLICFFFMLTSIN